MPSVALDLDAILSVRTSLAGEWAPAQHPGSTQKILYARMKRQADRCVIVHPSACQVRTDEIVVMFSAGMISSTSLPRRPYTIRYSSPAAKVISMSGSMIRALAHSPTTCRWFA